MSTTAAERQPLLQGPQPTLPTHNQPDDSDSDDELVEYKADWTLFAYYSALVVSGTVAVVFVLKALIDYGNIEVCLPLCPATSQKPHSTPV
ncbi:hypothetical protein FA15DRAFT_668041 [Coprinopsis marcescibilis]|uniref:Uncharacterized protein n=1 Tax=Coprinopsis marcescibilis TaxID=230819 RepID=A0A5C3KYY5_COPMA|nr:hypothetical protein FA15DRAFT_668041 [Coprinopsis marcescibilis]